MCSFPAQVLNLSTGHPGKTSSCRIASPLGNRVKRTQPLLVGVPEGAAAELPGFGALPATEPTLSCAPAEPSAIRKRGDERRHFLLLLPGRKPTAAVRAELAAAAYRLAWVWSEPHVAALAGANPLLRLRDTP